MKEKLNNVLFLLGCILLDNDEIEKANKAASTKEVLSRTNKLKTQLEIRNVHNIILNIAPENICLMIIFVHVLRQ